MSDATRRIRRRRWTPAEDEVVKGRYGDLTAAQTGALIDRTEDSVYKRAIFLGMDVRGGVPAPWTGAELDEVRRCYATESPQAIARRIERTPSAVSQQAKVLGVTGRKAIMLGMVRHDYFADVTTAEQAYLLGLLAADGNVTTGKPRITFGQQAKDSHLVGWVRDQLSPGAGLSERPGGYKTVQVTSEQIVADLARYHIVPRKSRTLQWPHHLGELQRPYLLGYFDGDGSMFTPRGKYAGWTVCSGSEQFLVDLKKYVLAEIGVAMQAIQHRKSADLWQVAATGRTAIALDEWLHQDGLGLERKRLPSHIVEGYGIRALGVKIGKR